MAKGKTDTKKVIINNVSPAVVAPIARTVELIVVNDQLVPDKNDTEPGVNSLFAKN